MKALTAIVALAILGGASQSTTERMTGSWTARFEGRTFIRLELKAANGVLNGGIALGDIEVDAQGAVSHVGELPAELTPIFDVTLHDSTLTFSRKDDQDTDRFELRLLDDGASELRFLLDEAKRQELAADGIPVPKPIRLTKQ